MTAIHFKTNRFFWLSRALGAIVMAALGGAMFASVGRLNATGCFGLAGVLFFGAGAIVGFVEGTRRGPRLTIDEEGVHDRTLKVGVIAWDDIVGIAPYGIAGQAFVGLRLRDPSKYLARASWMGRVLARLNSGTGFSFSLNLAGLKADPSEVVDLLFTGQRRI